MKLMNTTNRHLIVIGLIVLLLSACGGTNPVTGKRQITLMSQAEENALGAKQYTPSQQSQGGRYEITPQLNDYVSKIGRNLARHSAQPNLPYEFVVLNNDVPNAWALPGGKIAINTGLLVELKDEAEMAAVIGHEIVHAAARHSAEQMATATGFQLLAGIAAVSTDNQLYQQAAMLGAGGFIAKYGRENELESDYYGINYMVAEGYDPQAAVGLQQTFVRLSEQSGQRSDWFSSLFASHPPSRERVARNQQRANQLPSGKRNQKIYQANIRQLLKDKPAYEKHQQALTEAKKKNWDAALSLTNQAIRLQPKEARFHITQGRIYNQKDNDKRALSAFNKAASLEPNYFMGRLFKGLQLHQMANYSQAKVDLEASHRLLPNQTSSFYLGDIAQRNNQRTLARNYYQQAAKGGGKLGEEATGRLQNLQ